MASTAIPESESSVQLRLVEILTGNEDVEAEDDTLDVNENDFETVTGYLSTHSTSSIIVKLACQTLEKVAFYSTTDEVDLLQLQSRFGRLVYSFLAWPVLQSSQRLLTNFSIFSMNLLRVASVLLS